MYTKYAAAIHLDRGFGDPHPGELLFVVLSWGGRETIVSRERTLGEVRYLNTLRQPLHQVQWSSDTRPHSEHFIVLLPDSRCKFGQLRFPPRALWGIGSLFAGHFSSLHCSSAMPLSAGPFLRSALYNPNFKGSAWCVAPPPPMPFMSSTTDAVVLSVFSFVPRCSHPVATISECLLLRVRMR